MYIQRVREVQFSKKSTNLGLETSEHFIFKTTTISTHLENSKNQVSKNSVNPDLEKYGKLVFNKSANPDLENFESQAFKKSANPDLENFGTLAFKDIYKCIFRYF